MAAFSFETEAWQDILIFSIGKSAHFLSPETPFAQAQHGASAVEFIDIDGDKDQDFFYGDFFHKSLYYLQNDGSPEEPMVAITDSLYPQPQPIQTQGYNIPRFADLDNDSDYDLFISAQNQNRNNFLHYLNIGDSTNAQYKIATTEFLTTIDVGSNSVPALADIDADGDQDLFIGSIDGNLIHYENIGTPTEPSFEWMSDTYQGIKLEDFTATPTFVDIDDDGDFDLFMGSFFGRLTFFENIGTPSSPSFSLITTQYQSIDVGNAAAPFFADADNDGDYDLFIGESNRGVINIYENIGNAASATFELKKEFHHEVLVDDAIPFLYDRNEDDFVDLFIGQRNGTLLYYQGTAMLDSFALVESEFLGIDVGFSSAPAFADLNGDGTMDLFIGEQVGGLNYYQAEGPSQVEAFDSVPHSFELSVYPNPFRDRLNISLNTRDMRAFEKPHLVVYNLIGAQVVEIELTQQNANLWRTQWITANSTLPAGVYFLKTTVGRLNVTKKVLFVR